MFLQVPYTMTGITIPSEDIIGTGVNVFNAMSPVLIVVGGLAFGFFLLSKVVDFFMGQNSKEESSTDMDDECLVTRGQYREMATRDAMDAFDHDKERLRKRLFRQDD